MYLAFLGQEALDRRRWKLTGDGRQETEDRRQETGNMRLENEDRKQDTGLERHETKEGSLTSYHTKKFTFNLAGEFINL